MAWMLKHPSHVFSMPIRKLMLSLFVQFDFNKTDFYKAIHL